LRVMLCVGVDYAVACADWARGSSMLPWDASAVAGGGLSRAMDSSDR